MTDEKRRLDGEQVRQIFEAVLSERADGHCEPGPLPGAQPKPKARRGGVSPRPGHRRSQQ